MNTRADPDPQGGQCRLETRLFAAVRRVRPASSTSLAVAALIASAPLLAAEDEGDASYVHPLVNQALETEKTDVEIPWANPETGNRGIIVVERTFYRDEQPCRDYRRTVQKSGSPPLVIDGTGCRVGPGHWELDEEPPTTGNNNAVEPAAGPATRKPEPERAARTAPSSATAGPDTSIKSETEATSEEAAADPATASETASDDGPPKPPPFPSYTMPSPARL